MYISFVDYFLKCQDMYMYMYIFIQNVKISQFSRGYKYIFTYTYKDERVPNAITTVFLEE